MERSYGFLSNFASKQIIFIAHIGEIYYKGLDIPFLAIVSLVLSDPIAVTCCVNFGARFTKFLAIVSL